MELVASVAGAERLDVLHLHYGLPFAAVAAAVRARLGAAAPRLVLTLHGTDVSRTAGDQRRALARILPRLDAVTTVSRSHASAAAVAFDLRSPPRVIPNFVDAARFRPAPPSRGGRRRPRIVHVSNFRAVKRPECMARVFLTLRRHVAARLWLVGDGERMPVVRSILRDGGAERDVRYFGLRSDVHAILPHADVLLLTSRYESFSLAALEAAACGVPVVAPNVGGLPEVVGDGGGGVLYEAGDEAGAVRRILDVLRDGSLAAALRERGLHLARRLSAEAVVAEYEALYLDVLRTGGASRGEPVGAEA